MSSEKITLKAGTRSSQLAKVQTRKALDRIEEVLPYLKLEMVTLSSPGDRDRTTDLRESPQDFFTKDLDDAVRKGDVDFAVHSAKDLPDPVPDDIDWFWLPWHEDRGDSILMAEGRTVADLKDGSVVGISSDRRSKWCRERFPNLEMRNIRGNIESRIEQLDNGDYDMIVMATAALNRLGLQDRITEVIPLSELPPPDGQGYLAVTFLKGNELLNSIRSLFTRTVTFVGAGIGHADMCTEAGIKALKSCDVCLYDALMPQTLVDYLPPDAVKIDSGKRCGDHHLKQPEINELISVHARRGSRVVRLKGGDPGVFGRLAEEIDTLEDLRLPYRVIPGISSQQLATTGTGMLMTRRGLSRGYTVMTPRQGGGGIASVSSETRNELPIVFFMASKAVREVAQQLIDDGTPADTPAAIVYGAGSDSERIVRSPLECIAEVAAEEPDTGAPGLFLVGDVTDFSYNFNGALRGRKVLLTCSEALVEKAERAVRDYNGIPISRPLIELKPRQEAVETVSRIESFDWAVITSPSAARCLLEVISNSSVDIRRIPKILVCGSGTAAVFENIGIRPDAMPEKGFSAKSVIKTIEPHISGGEKILRLRSDKAGTSLAEALTDIGAEVADCILYDNGRISYDSIPDYDAVFFASASAVEAYIEQYGTEALSSAVTLSIGKPTADVLTKNNLEPTLIGREATVESAIETLAEYCTNEYIKSV